jgi:hypothetical protein
VNNPILGLEVVRTNHYGHGIVVDWVVEVDFPAGFPVGRYRVFAQQRDHRAVVAGERTNLVGRHCTWDHVVQNCSGEDLPYSRSTLLMRIWLHHLLQRESRVESLMS